MTTEPLSSYEHSADYTHIEIALKSLWQPFNELVAEMDSFAPRPLSDYDDQRNKEFERLRELGNEHLTDEQLRTFVNDQIDFSASEKIQFADRFSDIFMTRYVIVTMLSHALCEGVINAILAIGLVQRGTPELFSLLEPANLKEKWRIGPKSFSPNYELRPGAALFETLSHLARQRNALVHYKIDLRADGKTILGGPKTRGEHSRRTLGGSADSSASPTTLQSMPPLR
jgi:hypothetical protein